MNFRMLVIPVAYFLVAPLAAAEPEEDAIDASKRCINTGSILQTRIIDDGNIVFMMRRDKMYLNTLRGTCTGLARRGSFTYTIQTRSLCELETINVIEDGHIGQALGRSCTLGRFQPVTMEELEDRFAPLIQERRVKKAGVPPIEEISGDDDTDDADDADEEGTTDDG